MLVERFGAWDWANRNETLTEIWPESEITAHPVKLSHYYGLALKRKLKEMASSEGSIGRTWIGFCRDSRNCNPSSSYGKAMVQVTDQVLVFRQLFPHLLGLEPSVKVLLFWFGYPSKVGLVWSGLVWSGVEWDEATPSTETSASSARMVLSDPLCLILYYRVQKHGKRSVEV
ncbi:hypothetical protein M0802_010373 [Mischocyttarus mexicanus]|nr:hypothetical protein M0802_010373 [Mischocyttarus mexicanus]